MNNNSEQINRYLQNEMSAEEKNVFEAMLSTDKNLQQELNIQRQVINAVMNAGLKNEFAKAIRKRAIVRKIITWSVAAAVVAGIIVVFNFRQNIPVNIMGPGKIAGQEIASVLRPFVDPPFAGVNVPWSEYNLDAEKGGTFYYQSGSVIYFPPLSLVDGTGNPVKGTVKITYREFADPLDFFVSGIPMQYDSAGQQYNFESSGMCEINAYKDNKAVYVNQKAKPEINISTNNKSPLHNLYFLDTANRKWEYKGKDIITEVKNLASRDNKASSKQQSDYTGDLAELPAKPVMPKKASIDKQKFSVEINPEAFEELKAYDGLRFEVADENNYNPTDANEQWETMNLERSNTEGVYNITFISSKRKVTYKVRPVLEGEDYNTALKLFNEKKLAYDQALKIRMTMEQQAADSINTGNQKMAEKSKADEAWNDKMNAMIIKRNKEMRELKQKMIAEQQRTMQEQKSLQDQDILDQMLQASQRQFAVNVSNSREVLRTFTVNSFGTWNMDQPMQFARDKEMLNKEMSINAKYSDSLNNKIALSNISVVYRRFNGLSRFVANQPLSVLLGEENMLWGNIGSSFYYFSYQDYKEAGINRKSREFTFKMRKAPKPISTYEDIRKFVEKI